MRNYFLYGDCLLVFGLQVYGAYPDLEKFMAAI
ncbi:GSCOCG00010310001-RA-CDS [Cotesia congregata]|nr:GSCOCG00010310001-RA-CDS [Cotesia congregata]